jgi:hypothetical protein
MFISDHYLIGCFLEAKIALGTEQGSKACVLLRSAY